MNGPEDSRLIDIIGGSGFIGTRLTQRLRRSLSADVRIIDKNLSAAFPELTVLCDVRDLQGLGSALRPGSVIVNLAAEHRDDVQPVSLYFDVNVQGARNICAIASQIGCRRILFTSSVAVYGTQPPSASQRVDESSPLRPETPYGQSKAEAEQVFLEWQAAAPETHSLAIVRPTVVFGEGNRGNVFQLIRAIATGKFTMVGDGKNVKSICYVENCAAFLEHLLFREEPLVISNYVDKPDLPTARLVDLIAQASGKGAVKRLPLPTEAIMLAADVLSALPRAIGLQPSITLHRVQKFLATTQFETNAQRFGFTPEVGLVDALLATVRHEISTGAITAPP